MDKRTWQSYWNIPVFSPEEGRVRHSRIRELMGINQIDCLIIAGHNGNYRSAAADIRYVSNFCSWFDEQYIVFPFAGEPVLFAWSEGQSITAGSVSFIPVRTVVEAREHTALSSMVKGPRDWAGAIVRRIKELGLEKATLGISSLRTMPANVYVSLREQLPDAKFLEAGGILRQCRLINSPAEIEFLRKSGEIADEGFKAMLEVARPGVSEALLTASCESAMIKAGGELGNFILVGSGPWSERAGTIPIGGSQRILEEGDIILTEITANYGGYYTQFCRPISLGAPPDDFMELCALHKEMYNACRQALRPGTLLRDIRAKWKEIATQKRDVEIVLGIQTSELNDTSLYYLEGELKPGMCWVNHPWTGDASVMKGHSGRIIGHTLGDTYIVTEDEPECLSKLPLDVSIV